MVLRYLRAFGPALGGRAGVVGVDRLGEVIARLGRGYAFRDESGLRASDLPDARVPIPTSRADPVPGRVRQRAALHADRTRTAGEAERVAIMSVNGIVPTTSSTGSSATWKLSTARKSTTPPLVVLAAVQEGHCSRHRRGGAYAFATGGRSGDHHPRRCTCAARRSARAQVAVDAGVAHLAPTPVELMGSSDGREVRSMVRRHGAGQPPLTVKAPDAAPRVCSSTTTSSIQARTPVISGRRPA
jgi:hypothetical protein